MILLVFLLLTTTATLMACLNYHPALKNSGWYTPLMVLGCNVLAVLWVAVMKLTGDDNHRRFIVSLWWDACSVTTFTFVPLLLFDVKLHRGEWVGLLLVVMGLLTMKALHG